MARSRASAKTQGSRFETWLARYLRRALPGGEFIERRTKTGSKDTGDLANVRTWNGERVVVEVKNVSKMALAEWVKEARTEADNDGARIGVVIHKRLGKGALQIGQSYVTMELDDFVRLLGGVEFDPKSIDIDAPDDLL